MNRWKIHQAVAKLNSGGVIAYPTESVFGLGCDASNLTAIERLLSIKNRAVAKGLIILVSDIEQALSLLEPLSQQQIQQLNQPTSRATTWLIDCLPSVSRILVGNHQQIAVRITNHPVAAAICKMLARPLISTSANLSGKPTYSKASQIRSQMGQNLDAVIAGQCGQQSPSQIVDLTTGNIIRR